MFRTGSFKSHSLLLALLAQAAAVCMLVAPAGAITVPASSAALSLDKMFANPANSDALRFSIRSQDATLVSDAVFGGPSTAQLSAKSLPGKAQLFGQILGGAYSAYDQPGLRADQTAAVAGVRFHLFGGEQTIEFQNAGTQFGVAPLLGSPSSTPQLFAFYNFAQLTPLPENANGLAPTVALPSQNDTGLQSLGSVSFPSVATLRPQTAEAYNGLTPNTRGAAVEFQFPLVFSGLKGNFHLNGQSLRDIQPDSLATQIFGPAFATSVTRNYNSLGAGVTLALPLLDRKATVSLDGLYESLKRNDKSSFLYAANASYLANNPNALPYNSAAGTSLDVISVPSALYFYPNFIDVQHFASGASLAVPVGKALTVNGGFSQQRYSGVALDTLTQDLSQGSRSISGGLVYNIPKTHSSIDLFFNRYQYFDDVVPASNHTENRQNIYFSVKF